MSNYGGGLRIKGDAGVGARIQEEIHNCWDTFEDVEILQLQRGFPPVDKPQDPRPVMTAALLVNATGPAITELYANIGAWLAYATNLLSVIRGNLLQVSNEMRFLTVELREGALHAAHQAGTRKRISLLTWSRCTSSRPPSTWPASTFH